MERLGPSDYQSVLNVVREIHEIERMDDFPHRAMAGIGRLIESDLLTYNEIDTRRRRAFMVQEPAGAIGATQLQTFERLAHQHPLINHYARIRDSRPRKISDFLSLAEFRRLDLYQEFFRDVAVSYQMAVTIPSANALVIGIALNRARRDFSERDRSVLDLLRPHLVQAYRNIAERGTLQERAEAAERAIWAESATVLASLTTREHEILVLVAGGKTNPQIAGRLLVSPRTVQKHLEHVYDKLGVRTRTAAAMKLGQAS
ncbi:MAG TPA: LuxR C-terminal-related transcriptional regulator [Candidatus Dormibacteraeota bacterium]|nr:LuxR C-terminal-related transcriptional regulator [Candidatus Dormibacteraeota bacterium]